MSTIIDKLFATQITRYPGLKFLRENVEVPNLEKLIGVCGQLIFIPTIDYKEMMLWQCYRILDDKVEIIPEEVEAIKSRWRVYAVTPEEKVRLAQIRKLCSLMDSLFSKLVNPALMNIPGALFWDDEAGIFSPHENYVKGYIK